MGGMGNGVAYDASGAGGGGGGGTVTSVGLTAPGMFNVSGSPVTTSGSLGLSLANQNARTVFAGPLSGAPAAPPTFRVLEAADIPALPYGAGTVTSVGLTAPGIFSVSGSPVTGSSSLGLSLATQGANLVFAGPTGGAAAAPTFRALVAADLPASSTGWLIGGNSIPGASAFLGITNGKSLDMGIDGALTPVWTLESGYIRCGGAIGNRGTFDAAVLELDINGPLIRRAGADANAALRVRRISGTGLILECLDNFSLRMALDVTGKLNAVNFFTTSAVPGITLGAGAGTGALSSLGGTNQAGVLTITMGTGGVAFGDLFEFTYSNSFAYANGSVLSLEPVSSAASLFLVDHTTSGTTTTVKCRAGATPPAAGIVLQFAYIGAGF